MIELAVENCGTVSNVGLNAPSTFAAIRCGLTNHNETRFMDHSGQWIAGAEVSLEKPWRGIKKIAHMAAAAIKECLSRIPSQALEDIPLLICLAEMQRAGAIKGIDSTILNEIEKLLDFEINSQSIVINNGPVGVVQALQKADALLTSKRYQYCCVAASDSYLTSATLSHMLKANRLLTPINSDGFIPGEAGTAVLLTTKSNAAQANIVINGIGFGHEKAHILSEHPLRADGMVAAVKGALTMAGQDLGDLDYRICDISGEQYGFKEATLALTRILRNKKKAFDIWHPAECVGETGAAIVPLTLGVVSTALQKNYSKGSGILCHYGNDDGQRAAMIVNGIQT
jgi:3-oxoacyl-[acyl-carrier-protein] synthase-1